MASVTVCNDFGAPQNKAYHCSHCFPIYFPWRDGTGCHDLSFFECWVLSQFFHSLLSPSSRSSLVPLNFLPLGWCHLCTHAYWYFFHQSWFQLVIHPAWHFTWCTLCISWISRLTIHSLDVFLFQFWISLLFHVSF